MRRQKRGVVISCKAFCLGDRDSSQHLSLGLATHLPLTWGCLGLLDALLMEKSCLWDRRTYCLLLYLTLPDCWPLAKRLTQNSLGSESLHFPGESAQSGKNKNTQWVESYLASASYIHTLKNSQNLLKPQCSHLRLGKNKNTYLTYLLSCRNEMRLYMKHFANHRFQVLQKFQNCVSFFSTDHIDAQ